MKINPYLLFNGSCEKAFKFYEKALSGKIVGMMTHGASPMADHVPPEWRDKIIHVALEVDGQMLFGSDAPPQYYRKPEGFSVSLQVKDPVEAERIFNALAEKGNVKMPLQKTFWSKSFGMLIDQFDTPWMVNCEQQP